MEKVKVEIKKHLPTEIEPAIFETTFEAKLGKCKLKQDLDKYFLLYITDMKFNVITCALNSFYFDEPQVFELKFGEEKKFVENLSNFMIEITIRYGE